MTKMNVSCRLDTEVVAFIVGPSSIEVIRPLLKAAEICAEQGLEKLAADDQPRWNLIGAKLAVMAMEHILWTGDNGLQPRTELGKSDAIRKANEIDALIDGLQRNSSISLAKRKLFQSTMLTWKILFAYQGASREKHLADEVLPLVVEAYRRSPVIKSMSPQEAVFQHMFMHGPDLGQELLKACGYTEIERRAYIARIMPVQSR